MNRKTEIEARLDRSLKNQIRAPQLDRRFHAAVWSRIDGASAVVPVARVRTGAARWLFVSNVVGAIVAIALMGYFGVQVLMGSELSVALPLPEVPPGFFERVVAMISWPVTVLALAFGLMFTSLGHRLRSEFF
jgi:TRAP-type C4-dicarboxylate transport system permease small subunit